jgi:hypothetical protein
MVRSFIYYTLCLTEEYLVLRRKRRRLFHEIIRKQTTSNFYPHIVKATSSLLVNLLQKPEDLEEHTVKYGATTVFSSAYGSDITPEAGFSMEAWSKVAEMTEAGTPGSYLVVCLSTFLHIYNGKSHSQNIIPILKYVPAWLPGAGFKRHALNFAHTVEVELAQNPYDAAKQKLVRRLHFSLHLSDSNLCRLKEQSNRASSPAYCQTLTSRISTLRWTVG